MQDTVIAGRYRLLELLGRSGMSEVWRAADLELGRDVALKLLAPDADTARFDREARAVASLGHPNVVQLYDYGESEGRPYMVLEYVPAGTLEDRLHDGRPLPDAETREIAVGIAAGLAHAHSRGVVHRDLKPANVLFDGEGRPKVADFGIARLTGSDGTLTEAGTLLGTAAYISPEQAAGEPATAASDVYSFGVILYRMLTGRLPFESSDPMELVLMHRDAPVPPLTQFRRDAPAALESGAAAALAKDPARRPQDGSALLGTLGAASAGLVGETTIARAATQVLSLPGGRGESFAGAGAAAEGGPDPLPPSAGRRLPLVVAGLLVLALAGGALAYEMTRPASSAPPGSVIQTTQRTPATRTGTTAQSTAAATSTAATTTQAAATQTTTQATTTRARTSPTTTAATPTQPVTTAPPPPTTAPATTAPPATTTAPSPPTDTTVTTTGTAPVTATAP